MGDTTRHTWYNGKKWWNTEERRQCISALVFCSWKENSMVAFLEIEKRFINTFTSLLKAASSMEIAVASMKYSVGVLT